MIHVFKSNESFHIGLFYDKDLFIHGQSRLIISIAYFDIEFSWCNI
jgi:hypothetical protein